MPTNENITQQNKRVTKVETYVVFPHHFVGGRVGVDFASEVHIVALFDIVRVHFSAEVHCGNGNIC